MNNATHSIVEVIIGTILLGVGIIYLNSQYSNVKRISSIVQSNLIDRETVYQQHKDDFYQSTNHEELYSIIMGYREYPIVIDGYYIETNSYNYEEIFPFIKEGVYDKQYQFDENHNIECVIYVYVSNYTS